MSQPVRVSQTPYAVEVEADKSYFWCACGQSDNQPFCDGSHKGSEFTPVKFTAKVSAKIYFCGCKATKNQPMCDGSHKNT
jgi:CDGSH-type Zn-finger protein